MKVVEYKMTAGATIEELSNDVNKLLKSGFQPYGHPFVDDKLLFQALVREESQPVPEPQIPVAVPRATRQLDG